jgi:hypothetical protein
MTLRSRGKYYTSFYFLIKVQQYDEDVAILEIKAVEFGIEIQVPLEAIKFFTN